jgi:hypothetical protein
MLHIFVQHFSFTEADTRPFKFIPHFLNIYKVMQNSGKTDLFQWSISLHLWMI